MTKHGIKLSVWILVFLGLSVLVHARGEWEKQLVIKEHLDIYDFPEQLVGYQLDFPENLVTVDGLRLTDENNREIPYQLSDAETKDGYLTEATVHFRTDLPRRATRRFTLKHDPSVPHTSGTSEMVAGPLEENIGQLGGDQLQVRVPWGEVSYENPHAVSEVPAPLLAIRGRSDNWIGKGIFEASSSVQVLGYETRVEEQGPLFLRYSVNYAFTGGRSYEVHLTVHQGDDHVTVDEYLEGFGSGKGVNFRFGFDGLDPDARLVMSNGGYNGDGRGPMCGPYTKGIEDDGELPYELLLFTPNSLSGSRATAFWCDNGEDALLLSINRPEDWQTSERYVWHSRNKPENFRFYARDDARYMETELAGRQRHWAIGAIPRDEMIIARQGESEGWVAQRDFEEKAPGGTPVRIGAGPEVRLYQRLTDFSLDKYKDMVFDFEESLEPYGMGWDADIFKEQGSDYNRLLDFFDQEPEQVTADQFWNKIGMGGGQNATMDHLVQYFWDWSGGLTHRFGAFSRYRWVAYANSRANWSEADRQKARAQLVFIAELADGDSFMPHHSMMGGHPNFISEAKFDLALAAAIFPDHP
ncbi:MAG: hypothetical protein ACOCV9_04400, partial [Marinilabiliaceae bacterium]